MSLFEIVALAIGLAMDCTAVAATRGLLAERLHWRGVAAMALLFGAFQAGMPLLGWCLGVAIGPVVARWDHWIAFVVLFVIGARMLQGAFGAATTNSPQRTGAFDLRVLLALAVATSIDALAVGVTLPLLDAPMLPTIGAIGVVAAAGSLVGALLGRCCGALLGRRLDVFGGAVLVLLGVHILLSHLVDHG